MEVKYHYVVFGNKRDYFRLMFEDAIQEIGLEYISDPIRYEHHGFFIRTLYDIHHNAYLNWRWNIPGKNIWNSFFYNKSFDGPICFVFLMQWCNERYISLFSHLRGKYPGCKLVLYLEDLTISRPNFRYNLLDQFDRVVSYDRDEANKYGFIYYPTFMSKIHLIPQEENRSDVCCWIKEKHRAQIINELFEHLSDKGIKCDFFVTCVSDSKVLSKGIKQAKQDAPYLEYLQAVVNSNCVVEIMQKSAVGYTLRTWEALLYNKRLLTNNATVIDAPFYSPDRISVFKNVKDIDVEELSKPLNPSKAFNIKEISPMRFIEFLEGSLL